MNATLDAVELKRRLGVALEFAEKHLHQSVPLTLHEARAVFANLSQCTALETLQIANDTLEGQLKESRAYAQHLRVEREAEIRPYAKRCDRFSAALERIMEICQQERLPSQIFEIAEEALIEEESAS